MNYQISSSTSENTSNKSGKSNSYYEEDNYYNRKVINILRERLKDEMSIIYKKYGFYNEIIRQLVNLKFNPELYYKLKVNGMIYDYIFFI